MEEKKKSNSEKYDLERRHGRDRRDGKLDNKYQFSVEAGFFLDMRRGERRRMFSEESLISLN